MTVRQAIGLMLLCGLLISTPAGAALIERDWLTSGDGLLTYDDVNHREWLDVTVSQLDQFGALVDDAVAAAKLELLPGGRFEGFILAGREEVDQLVVSSGFDNSTYESRISTAQRMRELILLVEGPQTFLQPQDSGLTIGVIDEAAMVNSPNNPASIAAFLVVEGRSSLYPDGRGSFGFTNSDDVYRKQSVANVGLMLYRIPEPSAAALLAFSIGGLSAYLRGGAATGNWLC